MDKPKKIGLALGSGGARGLAHIGVIKALEQAGIKIDCIAGTSMGAIVGGFYAATGDIYLLEEEFLNLRRRDIFSTRHIIHRQDGILFKNPSIIDHLEASLKGEKIENCKIPFRAVATNVENGDEVILDKGNLVEALRASSAVPVVFKPVQIGGKLLMDGGFANPVPADVVRSMGAEYVITVDVSSKWVDIPREQVRLKDIYAMIVNALAIVDYQLAKEKWVQSDLVVRPAVLSFNWLDFAVASDIIDAGRKEMKTHLSEVRKATGYPEPTKTPFEKFIDFLFESPK